VDIGSSFLPSDIIAAFLFAQLENLEAIQEKRKWLWEKYYDMLYLLKDRIQLPYIPDYATNNAHMFYIVCQSPGERDGLIAHLKEQHIQSVFHYLSLHKSPFYKPHYPGREQPWTDHYSDCLLRLPLYFELQTGEIEGRIAKQILKFFSQ
jgi:dTDP-4-amino-4,6-dideoxygalactose transaminase